MNASVFARKISDFCRVRLTPLLSPREAERLKKYIVDLVIARTPPPRVGNSYAWGEIASGCGIAPQTIDAIALQLRPALDAIIRELPSLSKLKRPKQEAKAERLPASVAPKPTTVGAVRKAKPERKPARASRSDPRPAVPKAAKPSCSAVDPKKIVPEAAMRSKRGRPRRPVVEFPEPLWSPIRQPDSFRDALRLQMQRHGDSAVSLYRAIKASGVELGEWTISFWMRGRCAPRKLNSLAILKQIERRYRLEEGYFSSRFPNQSRAAFGHEVEDIGPAEQRRLAWHLPDDFNERSRTEQEGILAWVRRNVISGTTEYRTFQAAAMKQRYALRFAGTSDGDFKRLIVEDAHDVDIDDLNLAWGIQDAPAALSDEIARLLKFKTSTLAATGFSRSGVWGDETAAQKVEHLGLMFGAMAAPPRSAVRGLGVPLSSLTLAMLIFPSVWDWYIQWREQRRGFYTSWEVLMLSLGSALVRADTGWLRQCPELAQRLVAIPGLISDTEIEAARDDWGVACDAAYKHALSRMKEIQRVARVHRDPFEAILPVLEAESPVGEYRKIADEIINRMPDERRYPRAAAEAMRSVLMIRLGMHLGVRQKNMRQLLFRGRSDLPSTERYLTDRRRGELRWNAREHGWGVFIPANAFKNSGSSYFGGKPFRILLPDLANLYSFIDAYLDRHRGVLLRGAKDTGTFFVKTVKVSSAQAEYNQTTFYEAWRLIIQRYGIFNPYTGRGAIKGLLPHGPHNVRDILATHILKQTGSYEQASYAIQDTPETVAKHYGRFLPQDKAALAARVLNKVWEAV